MRMTRLFLGLVALLLALCAGAADRSPFAQGHWWNPSRAGNGFEFFNVDDRAMIIWYTYEESGRPAWYTAQGNVSTMNAAQWPLLRHRWIDGRKAPAVEVGWVRIAVGSFEAATLTWNIGGTQGVWPIQPFVVSNLPQASDRTGSWFDPANSGWGFSLTEQGDVFGGVLFTYDAAGEPTWAAGFGREREVAELFTFDGACPSCAYRASNPRTAGRVAFTSTDDTPDVIHNRLTLPMAAGVNIDGALLAQLGRPASTRPADPDVSPPPALPPPPPPPAPPPSGMLFSFAEANAIAAPNSEAQVSIRRTGGASGAFDISYKFEGSGCARTGTGGPVPFADGEVGPKPVSVPMGAKGQCLVWIFPPAAPAGVGAPNGIAITVVPVVAGCPTPSNVTYAELGGIGNPLLQMQRSGQTVFMPLPAPADGSVSGQITFGESPSAATPQPVTLDISISRCPGVIETGSASFCNLRSNNGSYNAIVYFTQPYQTINASTAGQRGYCWAGDGGPYYVSARWTYESCPHGLSECGFAIQRNAGPY